MTKHFVQTAIDDVVPGMILSDDLLDHQGHVLLAQGMTLSESTIEALRRHQVETVPITLGEITEAEQIVDAAHHAERLALLYRKLPEGEASAADTLRQHIRDFRLGAQV